MSPGGRHLESQVGRVRDHLLRRAGVAAVSWTVGVVGLVLVAAWLLVGPGSWREGSNVPAVLDATALLALGVVGWRVLVRTRRSFSDIPLAAAMEQAAGVRRGVLRGALELERGTPDGVSPSLADRAITGTLRELHGQAESTLAGHVGAAVTLWSRRGLGFAALVAVVLSGLTVLSPDRTTEALRGIASPIATMIDPVLPPLVVQPGDVEVLRGTDLQLDVSAAGRESVTLAWQAAGDVARTESLNVVAGRTSWVFRTVSAPIEYEVRDAAGNSSGIYEIVPIDPLFVSDMVLTVTYPPHTGLPSDEYRGDPPPLRLPSGSTLVFEGQTSRPLSTVSLVDTLGNQALGFDIEANTFSGRWSPGRAGVFEWDFRDRSGGTAEIQPEPLDIEIVPDLAPLIAIPGPGRDTVMPLNLRQPLVVEAGDDYGLRRVELVAYRVTSFGERLDPVTQGFDVGGQRAILARPLLDVRGWGLLPGDTVRYFARAIDNGPAGQVSVSPEYALHLPQAAELRREAEDAFEGVAERLEEMAREAERQATENRDQALEGAAQRAGEEGGQEQQQADFQQREDMERALDEQQRMSSQVDSLREEMEALERMMEDAGQADPELRRQLEELQELLGDMNSEALEQRMNELGEALDQENLQQANQSLEQMAAEQEQFREQLEDALERFKRAALEQDFRATTSEAEELAQQEEALADALSEDDDPQLRAEQQQELAEQAGALEERMEALQERLSELGESEASEGVQEAQDAARQARQQMEEAQQDAERGDSREAGETAQEAAEQMQQAAQEMQEAMQQMAAEQMQAQQDALMSTAGDALSLARRQSELRDQMRGASEEQIAEMRAAEASLLQGVQNMAENLQIASEGAMGQNRELSAQMGMAMESLQNTVQAMESRRGATPSASAQAEQAIGDLNQLALMAIAGAEQMGQQGEGEAGEEMSEQLEQLAAEQSELMNQSTQLMPMQLGEQAMSEQMQQMSQGQQSVASDLGDLADEPGAEESLGDLQQLAQEAEMLAQELAQGRLTPEMVQRQERLFHRLLDAGRSLEREEFSEERESEAPGVFERGDVLSLTPGQLGIMPYEMPDGNQLQQLTPAVRQLVLEYFERLNRTRPGAGGS